MKFKGVGIRKPKLTQIFKRLQQKIPSRCNTERMQCSQSPIQCFTTSLPTELQGNTKGWILLSPLHLMDDAKLA